jgi:hypothetical protein
MNDVVKGIFKQASLAFERPMVVAIRNAVIETKGKGGKPRRGIRRKLEASEANNIAHHLTERADTWGVSIGDACYVSGIERNRCFRFHWTRDEYAKGRILSGRAARFQKDIASYYGILKALIVLAKDQGLTIVEDDEEEAMAALAPEFIDQFRVRSEDPADVLNEHLSMIGAWLHRQRRGKDGKGEIDLPWVLKEMRQRKVTFDHESGEIRPIPLSDPFYDSTYDDLPFIRFSVRQVASVKLAFEKIIERPTVGSGPFAGLSMVDIDDDTCGETSVRSARVVEVIGLQVVRKGNSFGVDFRVEPYTVVHSEEGGDFILDTSFIQKGTAFFGGRWPFEGEEHMVHVIGEPVFDADDYADLYASVERSGDDYNRPDLLESIEFLRRFPVCRETIEMLLMGKLDSEWLCGLFAPPGLPALAFVGFVKDVNGHIGIEPWRRLLMAVTAENGGLADMLLTDAIRRTEAMRRFIEVGETAEYSRLSAFRRRMRT